MTGKGILVDTSVVIDFLRRKEKRGSWLYQIAVKKVKLWVSILTHTELYSGASVWENEKARKDLEKVLVGLKLIGVNEKVSIKAGKIRSRYGIELIDAMIAGTAIENKLELATLNQKHFKGIRGLSLTSMV